MGWRRGTVRLQREIEVVRGIGRIDSSEDGEREGQERCTEGREERVRMEREREKR